MRKIALIIAATAIVAGCGGFYGGLKYEQIKGPAAAFAAFRDGNGAGANFAGRVGVNRTGQAGAGLVNGDIIAADNQSITVKTRDGSSKIIFYSPTTSVGKFVTGAASDMKIGETVMATGKTNTDGSVTADSIQIRPAMPAANAVPPAEQPVAAPAQ
ncbi:MAG: hypothetical protein WCT37_03910 [Patescibacteria group bacterium]|jgi:hypothetical protein